MTEVGAANREDAKLALEIWKTALVQGDWEKAIRELGLAIYRSRGPLVARQLQAGPIGGARPFCLFILRNERPASHIKASDAAGAAPLLLQSFFALY